MKNNPLVTIGIPNYNRPNELKKAIDSAIKQTYSNIEIIISDNCSPDPAVEDLCKKYVENDNRIKYHRQNENIGMAKNGEFVLNKASGEYFMWCMDDDWLSFNYIEKSLQFLVDHPDHSIVFGEMNFYNPDYSLYKQCVQVSFNEDNYEQRIMKYVKSALSAGLSFGLTRTQLMQESYTAKMRLPEDWIFMMKILLIGKGKYLPEISYNALNNGSSKDIEGLRKAFNIPHLSQDNFWQIMSENIVESILYDDFYQTRLDKSQRISLALKVNSALMRNNIKPNIVTKVKNKLRRIYERL